MLRGAKQEPDGAAPRQSITQLREDHEVKGKCDSVPRALQLAWQRRSLWGSSHHTLLLELCWGSSCWSHGHEQARGMRCSGEEGGKVLSIRWGCNLAAGCSGSKDHWKISEGLLCRDNE